MAGAGGGEPPKKKKRPLLQPVVRPRLAAVATLEDAVAALRSARNIMVLVGAGISVSCGVPDFRSEGGLYALARRLGLALRDPQDLFDIRCFDDDPADFYKFAHALWPRKSVIPSLTHHFLAALDRAGRLLRVYTQNIDGLEKKANIPRAKIVECHGTLLTAHCRGGSAAPGRSSSSSCRAVCAAADLTEDVVAHRVPRCLACGGVWKPDVTFFGESLDARVGRMLEKDRARVDLLLVIGTSLQVAPISKVMGWLPHNVPQILINKDVVHPPRATTDGFDVSLIGEADAVTAYLSAAMKVGGGASAGDGGAAATTRGPDAVVNRGAVWAPDASAGTAAGRQFVDAAASLLQKDAADEVNLELVTCDGCASVIVGKGEVWTCRACFGFDLCATCRENGGAGRHTEQEGPAHQFVLEDR